MANSDTRYDEYGAMVLLWWSKSYVVARRPGCVPFVMPTSEWTRLPVEPVTTESKA